MTTTFQINHGVKKIFIIFLLATLIFGFADTVFALGKSGAINEYKDELPSSFEDKQSKAEEAVDAMIDSMEASQVEADETVSELEKRVSAININDPKRDKANDLMKTAKNRVDDFSDMDAKSHLQVIGGPEVLPSVLPDDEFQEKQESALNAINDVNRYLIAPTRPGAVPEGDIVEDFIPQLIRQLFRFAWLVILISFVVSGIMFITAFDNDERITKAKHMIYYTLIGFAVVTLAFAIVKGVTDIDFFRFI